MKLIWCLHTFGVSIVDFKQINVGWFGLYFLSVHCEIFYVYFIYSWFNPTRKCIFEALHVRLK